MICLCYYCYYGGERGTCKICQLVDIFGFTCDHRHQKHINSSGFGCIAQGKEDSFNEIRKVYIYCFYSCNDCVKLRLHAIYMVNISHCVCCWIKLWINIACVEILVASKANVWKNVQIPKWGFHPPTAATTKIEVRKTRFVSMNLWRPIWMHIT